MVENASAQDHSMVETIQSLVVAFVLAMTFRAFVTEGFVIPTGSMAPTLLGQHYRAHSERTGWDFTVGQPPDLKPGSTAVRNRFYGQVHDPMLGYAYSIHEDPRLQRSAPSPRMRWGDRILVMKCLYPFFKPKRFDVVVFKNPTDPNGPAGNYIKRLIGLPDESIWLLDGDVFVGAAANATDYDAYEIQRKPEYVQRAVWHPLYRSDSPPVSYEAAPMFSEPWIGPGWRFEDRRYVCDQAETTELTWDLRSIPLTDITAYNSLTSGFSPQPKQPSEGFVRMSDLRVAATIVPESGNLATTLTLSTRGMMYEFTIDSTQGNAYVRLRDAAHGTAQPDFGWEGSGTIDIDPLPPGEPTNVEFWHVDQRMTIFINGEIVASHDYDWNPAKRMKQLIEAGGLTVMPDTTVEELTDEFYGYLIDGGLPMWGLLAWRFAGSPLVMHRVEVDRDLYYRHAAFNRSTLLVRGAMWNPTQPGFEDVVDDADHGFGLHPSNLAVLGPDHFFMCGDNSQESSDSRLWGNPHPLVAMQVDPSPFVVHRKLLLGKAWVVYFPATHSFDGRDGKAVIPDFGRLRFVR